MKNMLVPYVELSGATISEALECVRKVNVCEEGAILNLILLDDVPQKRFSLKLNDIPLHEALRYCAEQVGLEVRYRDNAAILHKPGHLPRDVADDHSLLLERAKAIILPKIEFKDADINDCISFVGLKCHDLVPRHGEGNINIELKVASPPTPKISLSLREVSAYEVLLYVATMANCELKADKRGRFVIEPK